MNKERSIRLDAYHATNKSNGHKIIENGFEISTKDNEWLGHGIYFWDSYYTANKFWLNAKAIEKENSCIIKAVLICKETDMLNLDKEEEMLKFEKFVKDLKNELIAKGKYIPLDSKEKEKWCFYTNYFKLIYNVDIIKRTFVSNEKKYMFGGLNRTQFCVSDLAKTNCITSIERCNHEI